MMMSCVGFEVYKFSEPPLLVQQLFQSPPFGCLKIFGAPPQYLHPPPLVILNELSLTPSKPIFLFIKNLLKTGFVIEIKYLKLYTEPLLTVYKVE